MAASWARQIVAADNFRLPLAKISEDWNALLAAGAGNGQIPLARGE